MKELQIFFFLSKEWRIELCLPKIYINVGHTLDDPSFTIALFRYLTQKFLIHQEDREKYNYGLNIHLYKQIAFLFLCY